MSTYKAIYRLIDSVQTQLADQPLLASTFAQCFPNALETTIDVRADGSTFILTGDIPAMWLRDASAQVAPYLPLARADEDVRLMIRGLLQCMARFILLDPYANSFTREPGTSSHQQDTPVPNPWVWERKFELDSLCYPVKLCYDYWRTTQDSSIFDDLLHNTLRTILRVMRTEQHHERDSPYTFERADPLLPTDTLANAGRGTPVCYTGMVWSGFRPSDDACTYGFLIPANMYASVILKHIVTFAQDFFVDDELAGEAQQLHDEIVAGIAAHGIVKHPRYGRIYAYETDGYGQHMLMDDANVPSLLSLPYLGYCSPRDPLYRNTRRFILSEDNPYYWAGQYGRGIGSPHTPTRQIWPIALAMQGLTSIDAQEQAELVRTLVETTARTGYMHESFSIDDPAIFTRPWFAWANSLFSEFLLSWAGCG